MISNMAGVSDTLAPELPTFRSNIYQPYGTSHPLHLNSNASLVLVKIGPLLTPSVKNFVRLPIGAIPKKRSKPVKWCTFVSFTIFLGPPVTQSMIPFLRIYFPAPTTPSIPLTVAYKCMCTFVHPYL